MITRLKMAYPDITQPLYAYDAGALGTFDNIGLYFNSLKRSGLGYGYYLERLKTVLIVHLDNLAAKNSLTCVSGLRFSRARIIWEFLLGVTNPNMIG